jgi:hypothetical protein
MTSKNDADFVHFVTPALAPASRNGQSRAQSVFLMRFSKARRSGRRHKALSLSTFLHEEICAFFVATRPKMTFAQDD